MKVVIANTNKHYFYYLNLKLKQRRQSELLHLPKIMLILAVYAPLVDRFQTEVRYGLGHKSVLNRTKKFVTFYLKKRNVLRTTIK